MSHPVISPKKLIEVALPLDAINAACAKEKSIRHGHPSTLHLWWARRPMAAARAVIFSQLVNDPEDLWRLRNPGEEPNLQVKGHWTKTRAKLFSVIEDLVLWENTNNEKVLEKARNEIRKSWRETCELNRDHPQASELFNPENMPGLHDPFAGGGTIPLESQRLGLEAFASDLNPVAVLINKAMIEIPSRFADQSPVNPESVQESPLISCQWTGARGIARDVRFYGQWMRDEARKRVGHLYPTFEVTAKMADERLDLKLYEGKSLPVIAWLWVRTVRSPNPAFSHAEVPLASTFILSSKKDKQSFVEPIVNGDKYHFSVVKGKPPESAKTGTSFGKQKGFRCLLSGTPMTFEYIRSEAMAGRMGHRLMAIVAEGTRSRVYLSPSAKHESLAATATPNWRPDLRLPDKALSFRVQLYGMLTHGDLFTSRQLVTLTTFSDLVCEARERIREDATTAGMLDDDRGIDAGGQGAKAYAEALSVYLAFAVDKCLVYMSSQCPWLNQAKNEIVGNAFGRQAMPMMWDFAESNPFSDSGGNIERQLDYLEKAINFCSGGNHASLASQADASTQVLSRNKFVSTDPPYYDNIGYADLSDFFYGWLRRSLREVYPSLLATIAVPKTEELIATPYRHGSKQKAEHFFLGGMTKAMNNIAMLTHPAAPITIYYAFKQSETEHKEGTNSTGWETFLEAVIRAGMALTGTWPMRTERPTALKTGTNSLASSIIMVCRPRQAEAGTISRRQFVRELNATLPNALDNMTRESEGLHSPVAPVDVSQAIIGPGMAIFSRYAAVLEADGSPMTVKTALQLINRFLAEDDFDADTQFCLHWFEQYGWETGKFGEADVLARSKGTSVDGVKQAGILHAAGGNVRLLKWAENPSEWNPQADQRLPIWEVLHQLIRVFNTDGETGAAAVFAAVQSKAEAARQLAYRLYTLCERKNWAEDARAYNEVVTSWSGIESAAAKEPTATQPMLFDN